MDYTNLPPTRAEALRIGSKYYFTGKPCKNGHISKRTSNSGRSCFECAKERRKKSRAKNPEIWRQYNKKSNSGEKRKASKKIWKNRNKEKLLQQERALYQKNKKKRNESAKKWKSKNVEVCRTHCRNRKARLKNAEGRHTKSDVDVLYAAQSGMCVVCHASLRDGYHVDHIVAISRGGSNWPSNLQLLCAPCNQSKSDKDFLEWFGQRVYS